MGAMAQPPATLIYNPFAGRRRHGERLSAIREILSERWDLAIDPSTRPGEATTLARSAGERGHAVAFAWGGDGTIREVAEGILGSNTALGALPGGTTNVVPRGIGLGADPVSAAVRLLSAVVRMRDVGTIAGQPFLMQATAGLDGFLMREVRPLMKARYGFAGIVFEAMRLAPRYAFPAFRVSVDGTGHEVTGAGFANMPWYAGTFRYAPDARWDDGRGDVLLYSGRTWFAAVMFAILLALGRHAQRSDVRIAPADSLTFEAPCPGLPAPALQIDGDSWRGALPATCRIAPGALRVLLQGD
jgi:diacylglycerol kinase family enzyme